MVKTKPVVSKTNLWVKLGLVTLLVGVLAFLIIHAPGCRSKSTSSDNDVGSSLPDGTVVIVSGMTLQQTSDNNIVPLGGAAVTAEWSESSTTKAVLSKSYVENPKSKTTKTKSDGSYAIPNIPPNTVVTVTITSADTIQSIETITTSAKGGSSSAILKGKGKKINRIKTTKTVLNTFDDNTLPACQIDIPAGAVNDEYDNVYLTPTHQGENLPGLPDGYCFLAGADFSADSEITFAADHEATPYIILPDSVKAEDLSTADIKLMEYTSGGHWVINLDNKGKLITTTEWAGYLGPDSDNDHPAKLKGAHPWAYVVAQASHARIKGTVKNASDKPIKGALVFGGGSKANTKSDGTYTLQNVSVIKDNTLVPVNALADGYQMASQFVSVSLGDTIEDADFTLQPVTHPAEVYGRVTDDSEDANPIYGAMVTLQTGQSIRGMKYDDQDTPTDLTDDTFYVIPPPGVDIIGYKWMLTTPADETFISTNENGASVVLQQLAIEATTQDVELDAGAYKVELEVTYFGGKKAIVSGGFLIKNTGFVNYIADVKLPVSMQDQLTLKSVTDPQGNYRFINLPTGETFYASAKASDFITSDIVQIDALTAGEKKQHNISLVDIGTDTEPPSAPSNITGTGQTAFSILLTWSASDDNVGIDYYRVYRGIVGVPGLVEIGKTTNIYYLDSGLSAETTYKYQVGAVDKANWGTNSDVIEIATPADVPDTEDPTIPTNLAAVAVGPSQINLSWWPSSDDVGVIGYKIYRAAYPTWTWGQVDTTPSTSYSNIGLTEALTYTYKVAAYDAMNNTSDYSNVVTATTYTGADTEPPTVPLVVFIIPPSSSGQITVGWEESTDNVGVSGYKIYRSTNNISYTLRATVSNTTSYQDSGLSASTTYYYKVAAFDAAGNTSAISNVHASDTTQAAGGGNQLIAYWKFDETSGTTANDNSGNGNNGTLYGPVWNGGALSFDGVDDYVEVADSNSLDLTNNLTIQVWIKFEVGGTDEYPRIISKGWENQGGYELVLIGTTSDRQVFFYGGPGDPFLLGSNSTISSSVWNHIAVTYDGSTLRLYLNGSQDASKSTTGAFAITNYLLNIGRNSGHPTYSRYKGQIDDVKIYNYARSAGDIQAEYEAYWNSRTIVYASNQSGNYDIYLMKADGTGAIPLTNDPADEMWPKWSPDGTKISYGKDPYGSNEVWVMNADGSNKTLVKAGGWPPCWLPDNSGLIYTRYEENRAKVYKINLNGTNDTLFLDSNVIPNKYGIYGLSLNQDGTKLVWAEQIGSWSPTLELYKAPVTTSSWTVDTTNIVQLTNDGMYDDVSHARAWNNDGSKIVYWHCNGGSGYDGSLFEVYVMNADGTGVTQLTNNSAAEEEASWTPDGRIIFDSNRDGGRRHIFIMNADGTSVTQLTSGSYVAFQPCQR